MLNADRLSEIGFPWSCGMITASPGQGNNKPGTL